MCTKQLCMKLLMLLHTVGLEICGKGTDGEAVFGALAEEETSGVVWLLVWPAFNATTTPASAATTIAVTRSQIRCVRAAMAPTSGVSMRAFAGFVAAQATLWTALCRPYMTYLVMYINDVQLYRSAQRQVADSVGRSVIDGNFCLVWKSSELLTSLMKSYRDLLSLDQERDTPEAPSPPPAVPDGPLETRPLARLVLGPLLRPSAGVFVR